MYIPAHITGFFKIVRKNENLKTGSTGAGFSLDKGTKTEIKEGKGRIYFNGEEIDLCPAKDVLHHFKNVVGEEKFNIDVHYTSDFPLGCGMGTSGGCSLGLAHVLNDTFNCNEKPLEIAHIAEVKCNTGLGDVVAQEYGGIGINTTPGLPANIKKLKLDNINDYYVVVDIIGNKNTDTIINNPKWIETINITADAKLEKLLKKPTLDYLMELSYDFAKNTGLATDEIIEICEDLKFTLGASQAMLGNTIFCICTEKELKDVESILKNPVTCKIYE
ncbi:pantoate kinase [Methanococcus voltae]|uniref:Pantoate kinase n=2 Tax=Methanococcus voltae TaxID=2188 RepID=A0A8J7S5C2_METVO|nr:pantoate kinase [Methanococcus voltae]MBP2201663.1 pantoate kinase [Methanococcus voltae]MCS3922451.1 pantoate kinase [Methanococcus voltae PS]